MSDGEALVRLRNEIAGKDLDTAIRLIHEHPYFRKCFAGHTAMLAQIRNDVPSDVSVIYRYDEGYFQFDRMIAVSDADPTGPLLVDARLLPALKDRKEGDLQRRVIALHECVEHPSLLLKIKVFCSIYSSEWCSWYTIIVDRDAEFTWVLTFWCTLSSLDDIRKVRAGLERLAETLAIMSLKMLKNPGLICRDSLHRGLLVFGSDFQIRRTSFTAESMMRPVRDASGSRPLV